MYVRVNYTFKARYIDVCAVKFETLSLNFFFYNSKYSDVGRKSLAIIMYRNHN